MAQPRETAAPIYAAEASLRGAGGLTLGAVELTRADGVRTRVAGAHLSGAELLIREAGARCRGGGRG